MCAPHLTPRLTLNALGLDDLGLLVRHKKATPAVREAFARALLAWTKVRVQRLSRRGLQPDDVNDLSQEFVLRCLTRHFAGWDPTAVTISAYLYTRLRTEVIDRQRLLRRRGARDIDVDDVELPGQLPSPEEIQASREREARFRRLDDVVARLPRRQKMVMRRTLRGEQLQDIAKDAGLHHSTLSRDRSQALQHIHATLALAA